MLNVTPDSFSDGGRWLDHESAVSHGLRLAAEGAGIIDVGGESTRPGAAPVSVEEERRRVIPVVEALAPHVTVSIDTTKPEIAAEAVAAGARFINDVSASLHQVAADTGAGWIAMHMAGDPRTMQKNPHYDDVVGEVSEYLFDRAEKAKDSGVTEIWIDPGIGFGKTLDHNLSLLRHLDVLTRSPYPVVVGTSRKSFLGAVTAEAGEAPQATDRLEGSIASAVLALMKGVAMVRVHDVKETVRAAKVVRAVQEAA